MDNDKFIDLLLKRLSYRVPVDDLSIIRSELQSLIQDYEINYKFLSPDCNNKVIPNLYDEFIRAKAVEGVSKGTIKQYEYVISEFFKYVLKPINQMTASDIREFIYDKSKGNTARYAAHLRSLLNVFFNWSFKEGYIRNNPMINVPPIKYAKKQVCALTEKQLEMCRLAYKNMNLRDQTIFEFCYSTGCRAFEVCNLKKSDIDFDSRSVLILGKGNKYRVVYLNERVTIMLNKYLAKRTDNSEYVFVKSKYPFDNLSVSGLENIFTCISNHVGIKIHPHMMRHTTATIALNRGMPIEEVQQLLGHCRPDTTLIYATVNTDNVKYHHRKYLN